jgi:hypothetical protein
MSNLSGFFKFILVSGAVFSMQLSKAQDKIYTNEGNVIRGRIIDENFRRIFYLSAEDSSKPVSAIPLFEVDSIEYANGSMRYRVRRDTTNKHRNIPQLNTWNADIAGLAFLSVSQSYERRTKNGKIGWRVPLNIGLVGGGIAGYGTFMPWKDGMKVVNANYKPSTAPLHEHGATFSIASGLNPKFYLFRHRIVRAFIGSEATLGYSTARSFSEAPNGFENSIVKVNGYGTFAALGKAGLSFNPAGKINITLEGGAGAGDKFGGPVVAGWTGLWQVGLSVGRNF